MALDTLFHLAGNLVLPGWLLLLFAPRWRWTQRYCTFAAPLLLACTYAWLLAHAHPPPGSGFGSLAAVALLFSSPQALLAGWLHYLAFDLFPGSWEARDAVRLGISPWIVAPCLLLTFLFGPVGLALYLLVRLAMRRFVGELVVNTIPRPEARPVMKQLLRSAWRENLGLRIAIVFHLALLAAALLALPFDHRIILGLNPWIKPIKFDVSVLLYLVTVGALLAGLGRFPRMRAAIGWGIALAMIVEDSVISAQSFRGVRSHMNFTTAGDAMAFAVMGLFIALNALLLVWLLALYCAPRTSWPRSVVWGVRLGLATLIAGGLEGVLMVQRTRHTVGALDGGPGLPFLNWSTSHGDLRVAHFFAIHALQLFPLAGYAFSRTPLPPRLQVAAVWLFSAIYLAAVWCLFHQAMSGHPLLP